MHLSRKTIKLSSISFFSIVLLFACYIGFNKLIGGKTADCKYWNTSYYELVKIAVQSPEKYHVLGYSAYSSDESNVYYNCSLLSITDVGTFKIIGDGNENLAKDVNHVYFRGEIIEGADPVTYTHMGHWAIGKDKSNIYFETKKLTGVDFNTFEILDSGFELVMIKDRNGTRYVDSSGNLYTQKPPIKEFDL